MAAKARRYTDSVAEFNFHLEEEIAKMHTELKEKTYKHGEYRVFTVYDPKERKIAAAPFRDRVVHHAVHDVIEPLIDKSFIYHSYACRKNKGTHKALNWAQKFLRLNDFCFHGDIEKYFFSIDRDILKGILRKKIYDGDLLLLLDEIVDSAIGIVASGECLAARKEGEENGEGEELQRFDNMEEGDRISQSGLQANRTFSPKRNVRVDKSDAQSRDFNSIEHSRRPSPQAYQGIHSVSASGFGIVSGIGNPNNSCQRTGLRGYDGERPDDISNRGNSENDLRIDKSDRSSLMSGNPKTNHSPLATNHYKGLPIGNLTSQFFANLYLNELDYFVKFDLGAKFYIRYMDDFIIFENDREKLVEFKARIRDFLKIKLALGLHEGKSQIYNTKNGIKFLGFRIFKNHRRLATDNVKRFKKRLKKFGYLLDCGEIKRSQVRDSVRCWVAHSSYANTNGLRLNIFNELAKKDEHFGGLLKDVLLPRGGGKKSRGRFS